MKLLSQSTLRCRFLLLAGVTLIAAISLLATSANTLAQAPVDDATSETATEDGAPPEPAETGDTEPVETETTESEPAETESPDPLPNDAAPTENETDNAAPADDAVPSEGSVPPVDLPPSDPAAEPVSDTGNEASAGETAEATIGPEPTDAPAATGDDAAVSADAAGDNAAAEPGGMSTALTALIVLAILILPFVAGGQLAKWFRMPDHGLKVGVVLFTLISATIITITRWPPQLGPDLSGGVNLIYQIDPEKHDESEQIDMQKLIAALSRRVNPSGLKEVTIRTYGARQVEIIIPKADTAEVNLIKQGLENAGVLEFRITASTQASEDVELIQLARESSSRFVSEDGKQVAKWVRLDDEKFPPAERAKEDFVTRDGPNGETQVLMKLDDYNVTGGYLATTNSGVDSRGNPAVNFSFKSVGADKFANLTTDNGPAPGASFERRLGIVLDDVLLSAPNLKEPITGGRGQISGRFTQAEIEFLISILDAGSLPAALDPEPISELTTSATLGADTIEKGRKAMTFSMVLIVIFMIFYYRFAGFVACFALASNIVLLLAAMIAFRAAFTLPGIAGLVLTVGMAVDANVLIFERIREELGKGSALRLAIRNGFDRARETILDANLTTLITAVVLFWIGTDQIKGFAVTLILGIVMSMYTAIFCSRIVFEIAERVGRMTKLSMLSILGKTEFDFIGKRQIAMVASITLIALGLFGVVSRGTGLLDIDFMGGTSVTIVFNEEQDIAEVRSAASVLEDVTVRGVGEALTDEAQEQDDDATADRSFAIDTSNRDLAYVEKTLEEVFADKLVTNSLSHSPLVEDGTGEGDLPRLVTNLTFGEAIKYDTLFKMTGKTVEDKKLGIGHYEVSNPQHAPGSSQTYHEWELALVGSQADAEALVGELESQINAMTVFPSASKIGGKVARDTQVQAVLAILASLVFIVAYIWIRFQHIIFGLAAVLALVHDVLVTLGILALSKYVAAYAGFIAVPLMIDEFKISLTIVAAFLTIVGYSLNDTIVVFDRIREVRGKSPSLTAQMINTSINQTLSRTLLTSLTTLFVVVVLYFGGGHGIHGFAFALTVGVLVGTYSSVFVASPALLWMMGQQQASGARSKPTSAKQVA